VGGVISSLPLCRLGVVDDFLQLVYRSTPRIRFNTISTTLHQNGHLHGLRFLFLCTLMVLHYSLGLHTSLHMAWHLGWGCCIASHDVFKPNSIIGWHGVHDSNSFRARNGSQKLAGIWACFLARLLSFQFTCTIRTPELRLQSTA